MATGQVSKTEKPALAQKIKMLEEMGTGVDVAIGSGHIFFSLDPSRTKVVMGVQEGQKLAATALGQDDIDRVCEILQAYKQVLAGDV